MPLTSEVQSAVSLLENLQGSLRGCDEPRLGVQYTNDLNTLISVLHNPVLNKIIAIQDSLHDLKTELARHPSLLPSDFDISPRRGELTLHFPSEGVEEGGEIYPKRKSSKASAELVQSSSREILESDKSLQNSYDAHPLDEPDPSSPQRQWLKNGRGPDGDSEEGELINHEHMDEDLDGLTDMPPLISNATFDAELSQLIRVAAEGREIHHIQMYKPEGTSLGFSVVGLKSENRGSLGIYVQEIQSTGIAAKDGRLREGDQILAIDGHILDSFMSHQQAIGILQKANKLVDLVIARAPIVDPLVSEQQQLEAFQRQKSLEQQQLESILIKDRDQLFVQQHQFTTTHIVPPSVESRTSNMLNTEWAQVEVIHLVNDGSGLGFGIIGGRSTGVVVKTILPGGVADREGRLQSGDHILQIGEVNLRGMGSDQVASVLRQAGSHVRLVVARPVESASPDFQIGKEAPIVETRVLNDPEELDRHLTLISNGFPSSSTIALASLTGGNGGGPASSSTSSASTVPAGVPTNGHCDYINGDSELLTMSNQIASTSAAVAVVASEGHLTSAGGGGGFMAMESIGPCDDETIVEGGEGMSLADLPEMENIDLDLAKDHQGLGITIAGYVCEREELSGIFVKSINAGSAADRSGQIRVNDQIVEVDGKSLTGLSNHAAVEVLRSTGQRVRLRLARYLRGPKFEQLQQAIANSELKTHPSTPNPPRAPHCGEVPSSEAIRTALGELEAENTSRSRESLVEAYNPSLAPSIPSHPPPAAQNTSVSSNKESYEQIHAKGISTVDVVQGTTSKPSNDVRLEDIELLIDTDYAGELRPSVENAIVRKWSRIVGPDFDIVVAQLRKFERGGGLGISLEGTVDVEDGREVRPHHYIRSILPDGPVGRDGRLRSGDELLEVNNQKLLGLNHVEVVTILKDLPQAVRIVCGRRVSGSTTPIHSGDVAQRESFGDRNVLGGSLQSLIPSSERLVKAKSDGSLASSTTNANSDSNSFTKVKSRSLEPLTGLAMWSTEPQHIELIKGERGLGFSILDYQDPMNPQETVIVIRSLVPGGVAEKDGRLIPGDRLVGVNGTSLEKASLDEAVAELKGAPKGPVIISVAKPISVLESPGQLDMILGDLGSSEGGSDVTEEVVDWKCEEEEDNRFQGQLEERRKRRKTNDSVISTSSVPPDLPYSDPPPMLDRDASVMMVPVATERLIGGSSSSSAANSAAPSSGEEDMSPHPSPVPQPRIHSLGLALPKHLERTVRIQKGGDQLGINIQVVDQGVNGVVVSSVVRGGAVHKDGRIRAGDLIVSVNNESMRNISNSQARGILRRTQLVTSDVSIVFIPGEDAAKHRESRLQSFKPDIVQTAQEQRHPYTNRESSDEERQGLSTDLTRSSTAPSFVTRQLRSRDTSQEDQTETHPPELQISSSDIHFVEARPSSSLSDVSGAAATVVTLKNAISEVLGTEERPRPSQKSGRDDSEEGPFTITFRNVTEAGLVRGDLQPLSDESQRAPSGMNEAPPVEARSISSATPPAMDGKHWGPERIVEVKRDENGSLGISIVGGKVDVSWSGSSVTGIFVKNVLANSPAGRSGLLKTGDRILEVEGVDLRTASHEKAVEVIKKTGNPVTFVVQSLVQWNTSTPVSRESCRLEINAPDTVPPARTPTPELIQPGLSDQKKQKLQEKSREILAQKQETDPHVAALRRSLDKEEEGDEEESSDEEDLRALQGRTTSSKGVEIDRASAGALKRSKSDRLADTEEEDQFGYTQKKVQKKYSSPDGEVHLIELQKGSSGSGLGISLAGHKDRKQMSVYVCGMNPTGNAYKDGRIQVGDEILEVNGYVVEGRSHLNASTIFKGIPGPSIKIIVRRRKTGLQDMAVKPLTHFPVTLEDESPEEKYARFKGLKKFVMKKGQYGLGIMIIEGKHAEYGNGIFISDLQEGSIAAEAGLMVGDMILLVNKEEMIGIDYEMAASILKKTEGVITMWVANAARVTATTPTTDSANIGTKTGPPTPAKNTEPKKPEIPPKPSILPKPPIPAKPLSIHSSQSVITNHPETSTTNTTTSSHSNPASTSSTPNLPNPDGTTSTTSTRSSSLTTALHSSGSLRTSVTSSVTSSEEPPEDPSACEVKRGRESTIEIVREKMGLGLSIVGGTDTLLGSIVIHEIYPEGAVAKDGRLRSGDQILEVNNEDFRTIVHQKALNALRQTPSKVKFVVYREDGSQKEEDLFDIINVQLTKKSGKGLGLSIVGRKNGTGVFISDLVPGGVAESDGRLMQGDQIFEVNDKNLRSASQEHAAAILKCAPASVNIKIGRLKPGKRIPHNLHPMWPVTIIEGPSRTPSSLSPEFPFPQPPLLISPHTIPQLQPPSPTSQSPPSNTVSPPIAIAQTVPPIRTVVLERGDDGLGFSIVGGFGSNLGDLPVYVKCIFDRGAAAREGSLRRGDQILQVNGRPLAGLTHVQAVGILKEAKGTVTLTIVPSK